MLKNLPPIVSGRLLSALDSTPSGGWVAVVSSSHGVRESIRVTEGTVEEVVTALLTVTPLDPDAPIVIEGDCDLTDIAFAVAGLAADAEGHRIDVLPVGESAFSALLTASRTVVEVESVDEFGFLLCKGSC